MAFRNLPVTPFNLPVDPFKLTVDEESREGMAVGELALHSAASFNA